MKRESSGRQLRKSKGEGTKNRERPLTAKEESEGSEEEETKRDRQDIRTWGVCVRDSVRERDEVCAAPELGSKGSFPPSPLFIMEGRTIGSFPSNDEWEE